MSVVVKLDSQFGAVQVDIPGQRDALTHSVVDDVIIQIAGESRPVWLDKAMQIEKFCNSHLAVCKRCVKNSVKYGIGLVSSLIFCWIIVYRLVGISFILGGTYRTLSTRVLFFYRSLLLISRYSDFGLLHAQSSSVPRHMRI